MKNSQEEASYQMFQESTYLDGNSAGYVEGLYEDYLDDPQNVPAEWRGYFDNMSSANSDVSHATVREQFLQMARQNPVAAAPVVTDGQQAVDALIRAYRQRGHRAADINPLSAAHVTQDLNLETHGLSSNDLERVFLTKGVLPSSTAKLADIISVLKRCYCGKIGYEYEYVDSDDERQWLREQIEQVISSIEYSADQQKNILQKLTAAEGLEKYLDVKYPGQKRFSNEGLDSIIPMMDELCQRSTSHGLKEMKIGMAHRGRINVLMNVMGQSAQELFQEFDGTRDYGMTTGDVKYHRGFSSDIQTPSGPLHLTLAFNPSHLEFINTVVMGSVRARQEHHGKSVADNYAMAVLLHGDSAFAGQGIVMETLSMSGTRAYDTGGTIHIVMNNQVGFTTSDHRDTRSSRYCSDVAKIISAPVFHVNADAPEEAVKVMQLAVDYRMKFHKDVVIDLVGFRRHGHQEVDEPRATQPRMYKLIDAHPGARSLYAGTLIKQGVVTQPDVEKMYSDYRDLLDAGKQTISTLAHGLSEHFATNWTPYIGSEWAVAADTTVEEKTIQALAEKLETLPEGFTLQRNVNMIMSARKKMTQGDKDIDWGYGETMAYASLLAEGVPIRLVGEDSERGTFFHRHAVLHDQNTGEEYMPLKHLDDEQSTIHIYNSLLSEAGALGFEYGFSIADPDALVIWEAQFGDFANGAQVIIDQFISSGWQKWNRLSGLVMLLPHGYEGMGPEHSSARLERYMQLCAQNNMQVCVPTTPAQIFHLLRRQVLRPFRKPLIVMSPKSLLRHKLAVSKLSDLSTGCFELVIDEIDNVVPEDITRVIICSGKVYYELLERRREENLKHIAIIRLEQLYPYPYDDVRQVLERYVNADQLVWCQEEPKNQGAWFITRRRIIASKPSKMQLMYSCRPPSAAPAAGYPALSKKLQNELVNRALSINGLEPHADEQ